MKKIISWNVASIRARMETLLTLLEKEKPDIVFLQEIKTEEDKFPFFELKSAGYESVISGQKAWNGVAVLSKEPITLKSVALKGFEDQARFVEAVQPDGTHLISVYVPNGQAPANNPTDTSRLEYKLKWLGALKEYLQEIEKYIIGGDFNVIEQDKDVYNPALFENSVLMIPPVRQAFRELLSLPVENPMRQYHPEDKFYTFWDFQGGAWPRNHGIFLDYIFLSSDYFKEKTICADVLKEYRACEKPSDHAPIFIQIK